MVDCKYLLDVVTSLHLVVDNFADAQNFSLDNVDVVVGETVKVVLGSELSRPRTRLQILPLLRDHNVKGRLVGTYLVALPHLVLHQWCH